MSSDSLATYLIISTIAKGTLHLNLSRRNKLRQSIYSVYHLLHKLYIRLHKRIQLAISSCNHRSVTDSLCESIFWAIDLNIIVPIIKRLHNAYTYSRHIILGLCLCTRLEKLNFSALLKPYRRCLCKRSTRLHNVASKLTQSLV